MMDSSSLHMLSFTNDILIGKKVTPFRKSNPQNSVKNACFLISLCFQNVQCCLLSRKHKKCNWFLTILIWTLGRMDCFVGCPTKNCFSLCMYLWVLFWPFQKLQVMEKTSTSFFDLTKSKWAPKVGISWMQKCFQKWLDHWNILANESLFFHLSFCPFGFHSDCFNFHQTIHLHVLQGHIFCLQEDIFVVFEFYSFHAILFHL